MDDPPSVPQMHLNLYVGLCIVAIRAIFLSSFKRKKNGILCSRCLCSRDREAVGCRHPTFPADFDLHTKGAQEKHTLPSRLPPQRRKPTRDGEGERKEKGKKKKKKRRRIGRVHQAPESRSASLSAITEGAWCLSVPAFTSSILLLSFSPHDYRESAWNPLII